jgi:hypothetical protein
MSSTELDIEEAVVSYLTTELPEVKSEAIGNLDVKDKELIARAQRRTKGYVIIQYMGTTPENVMEAAKKYILSANFFMYLFTKSRKGRDGIYELLEKVRSKMINFEYNGYRMIYRGDNMHPFPVSDGLFLCEIKFDLQYSRRF